ELADAGLALGRADGAVQILGGDDVGRGHRPIFGDLNVLLLEDRVALGVGDGGGAQLPLDLAVRRDAGFGEIAVELESDRGLRGRDRCGSLSFLLDIHWGHVSLSVLDSSGYIVGSCAALLLAALAIPAQRPGLPPSLVKTRWAGSCLQSPFHPT